MPGISTAPDSLERGLLIWLEAKVGLAICDNRKYQATDKEEFYAII